MTVTALTLRPGLPSNEQAPEQPGTLPLPPRYSRAVARAIVDRVKKGNYPDRAALAEGVPAREFAAWRRQYSEGKAHPELASFIEAVDQGEAFSEAETVEELSGNAVDKNGVPIEVSHELKLKMLERRFAERYSPAERKVAPAMAEMFINALQAGLEPAEFEKCLNVLSLSLANVK